MAVMLILSIQNEVHTILFLSIEVDIFDLGVCDLPPSKDNAKNSPVGLWCDKSRK